ncbi:MAG: hypothetical protein MI824_05535 [Hyphomicrobiales bacterium]|nr:hypothetical protein [Hyphomicrobiales bacterium]
MNGIGDGSGCFIYEDPQEATHKHLTVWYHRPRCFGPETPIVMLLHGQDRAASYFRDCWREHAERIGFLAVAPEFDSASFPGSEAYNRGNVIAAKGGADAVNPRRLWTYGIVDRVFERVRSMTGSQRTAFSLFGHSAGAQFAHRYLALTDGACVDLAIAANAGWYMVPRRDLPFPAGLGGLEVDDGAVARFFGRPLVLLLGDADTDTHADGLMQSPEAVAQGPNRFARGQYYFALCRQEAASMGTEFGWRVVVAPDVGHKDNEVAGPAAELIAAHLAGLASPEPDR